MLHRMIPPALIFLCAFVQCSEKQPISAPPKYTGSAPPKYTSDLPQLQDRGALRVIVRPDPITYMPRQAEQVTLNYDIARGLAEVLKLNLEIVKVTSYSQMMEKLLIGDGDIVASSLTISGYGVW